MSSPDRACRDAADRGPRRRSGQLPPALRSMWRLCRLGFRYEPALMGVSFVLALVAALPDALLAVWFKLLGEGLLEHKPGLLRFAVVALAVSAVATWLLQTVSTRMQRRFRDKVTIALESHVARLQASIATIAHQERPEYLDRLSVLREQIFTLDHMYMSVFSTAGWILRLGHHRGAARHRQPGAGDRWCCSRSRPWRPRPGGPVVERTAQERGAHVRPAGQAPVRSCPPPPRPARSCGCSASARALAERRRASWERWYGAGGRRPGRTPSVWYAGGWAVFALGYVGAIVLVAAGPHALAGVGHPRADRRRQALLLRRRHGQRDRLPARHLDGRVAAARLARGLRPRRRPATRTCPRRTASARASGSSTSRSAIRAPDRPALDDVDLFLPAGSVVAVVGENGAGKSTLVKLLAKLYAPTAGRILVDERGPGPHRLRAAGGSGWPGRSRTSSASSSRPGRRSASATCRGWTSSPRWSPPPDRAGARDVVDALPGRPAHPARADLAGRRRRLLRPVAEARPGPRLHARRAAGRGAGRADRGARRRDRAPALRALRRPGAAGQERTAA